MAREQDRGIQIDEDVAFQRRFRVVQRIGLAVMGLVLAAALLGLLGAAGPLCDGAAQSDGLSVRYPRFGRRLTPSMLEVRVDPSQVRGSVVSLWISAGYLEAMAPARVSPRPRTVAAHGDRALYTFDASRNAPTAIRICFELEPRALLRHAGRVGLVSGGELPVATFIYP